MARNEEKQQGKLNRLWLQKERDEGRIKDVHVRRPKLSTLNSASAVKKWIPSIKNEIDYYLQQSQLSHYPERKIAEFQLCIEGLESEYKRFLCKLRALDPSCKHRPWTPRAYTKRRAEPANSASYAKKPQCVASSDPSRSPPAEAAEVGRAGSDATESCERWRRLQQPESRRSVPDPDPLTNHRGADQDRPLVFDQTRLAVALAGARGPVQTGSSHTTTSSSHTTGSSHTQSLTRALLSGLPNLHSSPLGQAIAAQARDTASTVGGEEANLTLRGEQTAGCVLGIGGDSASLGKERTPPGKTLHSTRATERRAAHILGLGCYSSSDYESDT